MLKSIGGGQVPSGAKIATPAVKRSRHERKGLQTFSFNSYSYKALKLIWPNLCISAKAMAVVNDFCWDLFFRVSAEVLLLMEKSKKLTVTVREIRAAVYLCFPDQLAKFAVCMGARAAAQHGSAVRGNQSHRHPVLFPAGRLKSALKTRLRLRVGSKAPVFLAAALQHMAEELFEVSGTVTVSNKLKRITPRHIHLAVSEGEELAILIGTATIVEGGVVEHIHEVLLPPSGK